MQQLVHLKQKIGQTAECMAGRQSGGGTVYLYFGFPGQNYPSATQCFDIPLLFSDPRTTTAS